MPWRTRAWFSCLTKIVVRSWWLGESVPTFSQMQEIESVESETVGWMLGEVCLRNARGVQFRKSTALVTGSSQANVLSHLKVGDEAIAALCGNGETLEVALEPLFECTCPCVGRGVRVLQCDVLLSRHQKVEARALLEEGVVPLPALQLLLKGSRCSTSVEVCADAFLLG